MSPLPSRSHLYGVSPTINSTPLEGQPDAALAKAAQQGQKKAFVEIVARHQSMVCGIAFGILGDFAASEDAAQDAFLTAWLRIRDLREPERLRAWLGQIARTAALRHRRKLREPIVTDDVADEEDSAPQPDEAAANGDEAVLVREALARLPEHYRLPLVLYYREGQSVRRVAEALDVSEDAVKQRLARGRDMLREQVTGMIESVLTRTQPTVVFTMLITAAIEAFTTPAAAAGAVFSASASTMASTGAMTGASSTTTTAAAAATAMTTSNTSLAIAAAVAVACLPLGYGVRFSMEEPTRDSVRNVDVATAAPNAAAKPEFSNSALYAEWTKLHEEHGATADAMPALYLAIKAIEDPVRRHIFRAAQIAEWAELAPEEGFAFFMQKGADHGAREQFFGEWLERDAATAIAALSAAGEGWDTLARRFLTDIGRKSPASLVGLCTRLPKSDKLWASEIRDAFALFAADGLEAARAAAESVTGDSRELALEGVAMAWAKRDADAAIAWARNMPEGVDQNALIRAALTGMAATDVAGALARVKDVPPGGREGFFADTTGARVLKEAAKADFEGTVAWLKANPGRFGDEDMMGLASAVTDLINGDAVSFLARHHGDGTLAPLMPVVNNALWNDASGRRAEIWEWLKTQPDGSDAGTAASEDPALALKIAHELASSSVDSKLLDTIAKSLLRGGQRLHHFDTLMEQAPEAMKPALLQSAFNSLRSEVMVDPQKWAELLPQLPEQKHADAAARLAHVWSDTAPEEALAWAATLPASARQRAEGSALYGWLKHDSWSASEWIAAQPPGPAKDRAAARLVKHIAKDSPAEAWEWAQTIGESDQRLPALTLTLKAISERDPAAAADWLASAKLSPQDRAAIESAWTRHDAAVRSSGSPSTQPPAPISP